VQIDLLQSVPAPEATMVQPRAMGAYGALIAAATLGVLYLYRGRAFIVYWIGAWLMLAAGLLLTTQPSADPRLGGILLGLALLLIVFAAGLLFLAAESFPTRALRWNLPIRAAAGSAVWFLAAPFVVSLGVLVSSGVVAVGGLLALGAWRYLQLARSRRYAGAALIGAGLVVLVVSNVFGASVMVGAVDGAVLNRLAAVNIVTGIFLSLGMHLLVFEDMTAELRQANQGLEAANEEVKRLAITDPLTGCHNRRFFDEIERREMQHHRRYGTPLSVVFVDVDRFKQLNDTLGHDAGDAVLRMLGGVLRRQVRESDYVFRWGGDEFLLLLACGIQEATAKARELKAAFARERERQALPRTLALSIGVAAVDSGPTLNDAIREADAAMYRDKLNTAGT
jgi:diguanylate cyclase (GGDEF)-like protein